MDAKILIQEGEEFFLQQFFTGCLAEMAYYVESEKVAIVIDPMRDYEGYINLAQSRGATIKYIFETHFHADFISGHQDLAKKTGATIVFGPSARPNYPIHEAKDEEVFEIGKMKLKVMHTPGHTLESSCFLLSDSKNIPHMVFTGDTLFLGDVGRPDLACSSTLTKFDLAAQLYESIQKKILHLPRDIRVYPAHGAGSSCGKNICDGVFDTLANQFAINWALQEGISKELFVQKLTNISPPPQYYFYDAKMNREGMESLDVFLQRAYVPLTPLQAQEKTTKGAIILDGRDGSEFLKKYIKGSLFLSLCMPFAHWIGTLFKPDTQLIVLTPPGKEKEAVTRLARIGYENVVGYLEGGIEAWTSAGLPVISNGEISAEAFVAKLHEGIYTVDVRNPDELSNIGKVKNTHHFELTYLEEMLTKNHDLMPRDKDLYFLCRSGQRSVAAISIMRKFGYEHLINITGGFTAVKATGSSEVVLPQ